MVVFSLKYEDRKYPDYICDVNWDYQRERGVWSRSIGCSDGILCFEYTPPIPGLDELAFRYLLSRFGLLNWQEEISIETEEANLIEAYSFRLFRRTVVISDAGKRIILRMSPAQLIAKRREKEKLYNLPRLEVSTDNLDIVAGKGKVPHYAEEYQ